MTINGPAAMILAFYVADRREAGHHRATKLRGTLQNDILKEYIAQKEWMLSAATRDADHRRHDRVVRAEHMPQVEHDLDLAATTSARRARRRCRSWRSRSRTASRYVEAGIEARHRRRRLRAAAFVLLERRTSTSSRRSRSTAPRAASGRTDMRESYGAKSDRSLAHALPHADGGVLADGAAAREEHRARRAFQALAAVLGGTQSLHTNSMDETLRAARRRRRCTIALRTQQIIALRDRRHQQWPTRSAARTSSRS